MTDPAAGDPKAGEGFTVDEPRETPSSELPKIDFSTFVLSLATSALFHMGLAEAPEGGPPAEKNLPLARQTIDTLEMLQERTRGNLVDEEEKLLQSVLYELHMSFVKANQRNGA